MISSELAKELKENGFPQIWPQEDYIEIHDALKIQEIKDKYKTDFYLPSLSELIEACGGAFESMDYRIRTRNDQINRIWMAFGIEMEPWNPASNAHGEGSFPEEAVANLWLKLNKK